VRGTSTEAAALPSRLHDRTVRGELRLCRPVPHGTRVARSCGNESDGLATGGAPIRPRRADRNGDTVVDMETDIIERLDLARTFVRLSNDGSIDAVPLTTAFWRGKGPAASDDRFVGIVDFASAADLHSASQEVHPDGDELVVVLAGALDVMIDDESSETAIALDVGDAAVVPAGCGTGSSYANPGDSCSSTSEHQCRAEPTAPKRAPRDGHRLRSDRHRRPRHGSHPGVLSRARRPDPG
jgi:mannose-6-phosphate isomerase-like protein (cupin superfamily)